MTSNPSPSKSNKSTMKSNVNSNVNKDWEKEFDVLASTEGCDGNQMDEIRGFIRSLLTHSRQELLEQVIKEVEKLDVYDINGIITNYVGMLRKSDVISKLKSL